MELSLRLVTPVPPPRGRAAVADQLTPAPPQDSYPATEFASEPEIIPRIMGRLRIDQRQSESPIVTLWGQIVDPRVAAHSQPVGRVRGTLFVSLDNSVWLEEIIR